MAQSLKKFIPRAPRYSIFPEDRTVIRFAAKGNKEKSFSTTLINVSQSGLAFRVDQSLKPSLGDTIMVEFTVPGGEQMACHGRVVRIEEPQARDQWKNFTDEVIVAVHFYGLRGAHEKNLSTGLKEKFRKLQQQHKRQELYRLFYWAERHKVGITAMVISTIAVLIIFYLISLPTGAYSPLWSVPWGDRFK